MKHRHTVHMYHQIDSCFVFVTLQKANTDGFYKHSHHQFSLQLPTEFDLFNQQNCFTIHSWTERTKLCILRFRHSVQTSCSFLNWTMYWQNAFQSKIERITCTCTCGCSHVLHMCVVMHHTCSYVLHACTCSYVHVLAVVKHHPICTDITSFSNSWHMQFMSDSCNCHRQVQRLFAVYICCLQEHTTCSSWERRITVISTHHSCNRVISQCAKSMTHHLM